MAVKHRASTEVFGKGDWVSPERLAQAGIHWGELARLGAFDRCAHLPDGDILRVCAPFSIPIFRGSL